jgi:uncharacterized protein YbaA (DUF1428 family)
VRCREPDKATLEAIEAKMHEDARFDVSGEVPFDAGRLIYGCFAPIFTMKRAWEQFTLHRRRSN